MEAKTKLEPLPKEITDEIRSILERCESGELAHDQNDFHCGTAHCIAGWKVVFDWSTSINDESLLTANFDEAINENGDTLYDLAVDFCGRSDGSTRNTEEWQYALEQWRLTQNESEIFFNHEATFESQFALLEKLERGERVE